jgi:bacterial/archaeal transporter family protein
MTSRVVPIVASYPLVTAILSVLVLREGITLQRIAGIMLAVVGIVLIKQN